MPAVSAVALSRVRIEVMRKRISLFVVIVLSLLTGSLILPALGRVREWAAEHQGICKYAQIGVALHMYNDTLGHLPVGASPHPSLPPDRRLSWLMGILPYVEQNDLYRQIDLNQAWDADGNRQAA